MRLPSVSLKKGIYAIVACAPMLFYSCQKDNTSSPSLQAAATEESSDATVFKYLEDGITKLVLRPSAEDGQDVYIDKLGNLPAGNQNYVPELPINNWTNGDPLNTRSFLRFDKLTLVPTSATVVSAKLYLYGLSSSLNTPQGNSWYPGAPFGYQKNDCYVQQVLGPWDETTLTYDNQPATSSEYQGYLAASTSQWNYNAVVDLTTLVQKMVTDPATNYGFGIRLVNESIYRSVVFGSSEAARNVRPRLVVKYQ
ncbi:hypothetical protein BH10BAC2_BH10BAC2_24000 [soil metagenome]